MKEIILSQGKVALVDDEDYDRLNQYKWSAAKLSGIYYAVRHARDENGKRHMVMMHREITKAQKGITVDHANGNGLDNQKNNLRFCTHRENKINSVGHKNTTSQYKGVSYDSKRQKWFVQVRIQTGKDLFVGRFNNEKDAAIAYNSVASNYFGNFARLNQV